MADEKSTDPGAARRFQTTYDEDEREEAALGDDAVVDKVNSLIFDHVARGMYHRTVVASSLPGFINEILETATGADWQASGTT
jgi:hypothetical protein